MSTTCKLADLNPAYVAHGGDGIYRRDDTGKLHHVPRREGVGLVFDCPCGCGDRLYLDFDNPLDGGPPLANTGPRWHRTGEAFENMTLTPSVLRAVKCRWHGWIRSGEAVSV